ncbi:hypothetical protein ACFLQL_00625 [Verrucomicrobiota bacterium]
MANTLKPGMKTSEGWLSIVVAVLGLATTLGYVTPEQSSQLATAIPQVVGGIVTIATVLGYIVSRTKLKELSMRK